MMRLAFKGNKAFTHNNKRAFYKDSKLLFLKLLHEL